MHILYTIPNTKAFIEGFKFILNVSIMSAEHTSNIIFDYFENITIGAQLLINLTEQFHLTKGTRLKDIVQLKN